MSEERRSIEDRRRFLKIVGSGAVLVPVIGIAGCSGGKDAAPSKAPAPAAAPPKAGSAPAKKATEAAQKEMEAVKPAKTGGMPKLAEDDPQAKALAYVDEATSVDSSKQPRYKAGQTCANCALFQAKGSDEWAGCSIFPGKLVKASGWCSVYAPKPG